MFRRTRRSFHAARGGPVAALVAALVGAASGCSSDGATAPASRVVVDIAVASVSPPAFSYALSGDPVVSCTVNLTALATGTGAATWTGATFYFYAGLERSTPVDSAVVSADRVRQGWGQPTIVSTSGGASQWTFDALAPFAVGMTFRYEPEPGLVRSSHIAFTCGPTLVGAAPGPTVSGVVVTPSTGTVRAGDTIDVSYAVAADRSLWLTSVALSGACRTEIVYVEAFTKAASRTTRLAIPANCIAGAGLTVTVSTSDVGLELATQEVRTGLVVASRPTS